MKSIGTFYINGEWVTPAAGGTVMDIVNPASEEAIGKLSLGSAEDATARWPRPAPRSPRGRNRADRRGRARDAVELAARLDRLEQEVRAAVQTTAMKAV